MVCVSVTVDTQVRDVTLKCVMRRSVLHMGSVIIPLDPVSVTGDGMDDSVDSLLVLVTVGDLIMVNALKSLPLDKFLLMVKLLTKATGSVDVSLATLALTALKNLKPTVMMPSTMMGVCLLLHEHSHSVLLGSYFS